MPKINYKEASKINWTGNGEDKDELFPGIAFIQMASLQRIADATEKMAKKYTDLEYNYELLKRDLDYARKVNNKLNNSNRSLKGWINRLKNKV